MVQSGVITYLRGFDQSRFQVYAKTMLDNLNVDPDIKQGVKEFLDSVPLSEFNIWTDHKVFYSANNSTNGNYLVLMTYKTNDGLIRVYTAHIKTEFSLGEDIYILSSSKSSFWGKKTKSSYPVRATHQMTADEATIVLNYMDMVVLNRFLLTFEKRANAAAEELEKYLVQPGPRLLAAENSSSPVPNKADVFLDTISKAYDVVKKIGASSTESSIIERITNLKLKSFSSNTKVLLYKGVPFHLSAVLKNTIINVAGCAKSRWVNDIKTIIGFGEELEPFAAEV